MHRRYTPFATILALLFVFQVVASQPAAAQLIVITKVYRVFAVDSAHNRIVVAKADSDKPDGNVLVGPDTKLFVFDHPIPNFSWQLLQKGMKITVKGGMTWDLKMKARQIYL